jgi:succinyl-CoA synthetase beta subunit
MDLIHQYGGKPANFLDVGGGASKEKIAKGCQIILEDPKVEVLLVNIFGGIMDCALIAEGILLACDHLSSKIPFVVRMEGTNVDKGREILRASKQKIVTVNSLEEAAKEAVSLLKR